MLRYAILYHQTPADAERPAHWDLLLQSGNVLRTWALASQPMADQLITAQVLADHRTIYLDYEGPISGNRGSVTRWDAGTFQWLHESDNSVTVAVRGERLVGQVTLGQRDDASNRWEFRYTATDAGRSGSRQDFR